MYYYFHFVQLLYNFIFKFCLRLQQLFHNVSCMNLVFTDLPFQAWTGTIRRTTGDSNIYDAIDGLIGHCFPFILEITMLYLYCKLVYKLHVMDSCGKNHIFLVMKFSVYFDELSLRCIIRVCMMIIMIIIIIIIIKVNNNNNARTVNNIITSNNFK